MHGIMLDYLGSIVNSIASLVLASWLTSHSTRKDFPCVCVWGGARSIPALVLGTERSTRTQTPWVPFPFLTLEESADHISYPQYFPLWTSTIPKEKVPSIHMGF